MQWLGGVHTHQTHVSQLSVLRYSGAKYTFSSLQLEMTSRGGQQRVVLQLGDDFSWWTTKSCFSWNCCVRVSDGLHYVCGYSGVCDFALRCSGARVLFVEESAVPAGWTVRRKALKIQQSQCRERHWLLRTCVILAIRPQFLYQFLYQQHHLQKRLHGHWFLCIDFFWPHMARILRVTVGVKLFCYAKAQTELSLLCWCHKFPLRWLARFGRHENRRPQRQKGISSSPLDTVWSCRSILI